MNHKGQIIFFLMFCFVFTGRHIAQALTFVPPDDPSQSIAYWKPHVLSPENNALAAQAQNVFSVLLRAWDRSRLEPKLFVVDSTAGPWAASLSDGHILISRDAIQICLDFGKDRAAHLLAFVLAHELAHQRADDLWHQRFFRLIGNQHPEIKKKILKGFKLKHSEWENVAQKEAQADHDGLIMMASVGYDPYQILDKTDFFTRWVENIWGSACTFNPKNSAAAQACQSARNRALRAGAQLTSVATQAMLHELGVQAFIAGDYVNARRYFTAYGREYPNRALFTALGLSHFAEALMDQEWLIQNQALERPAFYYPLLLDARPILKHEKKGIEIVKRADRASLIKEKKKQMQRKIEKSIAYFEKAERLSPEHPKTYLLLAFAYLLDGNSFMARGIIQGKYQPKFGNDPGSALILAMTQAIEGKQQAAQAAFTQLIKQVKNQTEKRVFPTEVFIYTSYYNTAAHLTFIGEDEEAALTWKRLAQESTQNGNSYLFRLALSQFSKRTPSLAPLKTAPTISGLRLGDTFPESLKPVSKGEEDYPLWIEGEQFQVLRLEDGSRYVLGSDQKIISAWQVAGSAHLDDKIAIGDTADRPLKTLGIPDRRLHFMSGDYLAYDKYGLAIHIVYNRVAGWFLY